MQKYYVKSHTSFLGKSGYNNHSKHFFTELDKYIDVYIRNFSMDGCTLFDGKDGSKTVDIKNNSIILNWHKDSSVKEEEQKILYEQTYFTTQHDRNDLPINNKIFNEDNKIPINIVLNEVDHYYFYDKYKNSKIAYVVWESTKYPADFFNKLLEFDQMWVPSNWQKECAIEQGYPENKIKIIPEGVDSDFIPLENKPKNDKFTFVIVGRWEYRKSTLELIKTFNEIFGENNNVKLKLLVDNIYATDNIKNTKERLEFYKIDSENIEIINFVDRNEYINILQTSDVFLSCARGEGWNLPLIEAISCGIITICSNWGAQLDFAKGISHTINIKGENLASDAKDIGNYCEPDFDDLKRVMLDVYENYEKYNTDAILKSEYIRNKFTWKNAAKKAYNELNLFIENRLNKKKLLMITPHLSTGGLPQVFYKKVINLYKQYNLKIVEYADLTAGVFTVQKDKIQKLIENDDFITLSSNKFELLNIIENFDPDYIHFEEIPEIFMNYDLCNKIYKNDRTYFITETTHDVGFNLSNKKFLPDKFMHVSEYIANKYTSLNIPQEIIEYPIENNTMVDRNDTLVQLGLNPNYKHVLNVGLFTPGKNQKQIFDIARKMPDVQFHFVGNQAGNFSNYWKPLMENKPDNCIIHGERSDVDVFYSCMDLFLFTSTYELNPIVIKEALSYNMNILMYNLDVYCGSYDEVSNIKFLSNDDNKNIDMIRDFLYTQKIKYPSRCYITHTTKNYVETTFGLIYSQIEYSNYPIVVFTVNFNINEVRNPFENNENVFFIEYYNDNYPSGAILLDTDDGKYVDRLHVETYKILSLKAKILLKAFDLGIKDGVYLDSDSVCRRNVDDLISEIQNIDNYPLFTQGTYDIVMVDNKMNVEEPLMKYLNVEKRSMHYVQSNILVFSENCKEFLIEWKNICDDKMILQNFNEWVPYQDETVVNVLLWKHGYTKHLPKYHFNIRNFRFVEEFEKFDDSDKSKYSKQMSGFPFYIDGEQMIWSYIPYDKNDVKVFHGIKKLDEMIDIIEYQNETKRNLNRNVEIILKDRHDLAKYLNLNKCNVGIEIGSYEGEYAKYLLDNWNGHLYMVDIWRHLDENEYNDISNQVDPIETISKVVNNLKGYENRTTLLRTDSKSATEIFKDDFFDFIYIDANHKYKYVLEDLLAWYPKLKVGGIFAGHDYIADYDENKSDQNGDVPVWIYKNNNTNDLQYAGMFGVNKAIKEFSQKVNCEYKVTQEYFGTWYFKKKAIC